MPAVKVVCKFDDMPIVFEVDFSAPITILPANSFKVIKNYLPPVQQTDIKLQSYNSIILNNLIQSKTPSILLMY